MEVSATTKYSRMSPTKARDLAKALRGLPVGEALRLVKFSKRKAGDLIGKTLRSAIANAQTNAELSVDDLFVKEAIVDQGPTFRRHWPRARGMVSPVAKRTSHIRVILSDGKS